MSQSTDYPIFTSDNDSDSEEEDTIMGYNTQLNMMYM